MKLNSKSGLWRGVLAAFALAISFCAHALTVSFQDRNYDVTLIPLANTVTQVTNGCDLIFVILPNTNQKFLVIPSDPTSRGVYDPNAQRFYRLDRAVGFINGFNFISSTYINLDGTFSQNRIDTPQLPVNGQSTLESYAIPTEILPTLNADIAILDDMTLAYRTSETKVYELVRADIANPTTKSNNPFTVPLKATGVLAMDFDAENGNHLLLEQPVVDTDPNHTTPDNTPRISAYTRDGLLFSSISLDTTTIPGYTGKASGIAYDVDNGDFYVLDNRQLIKFAVQRPTLISVSPNHCPPAGLITVNIAGSNIPSDATVFFGGTQALPLTVKSSSLITCTVPAHVLGTVDVTMMGTGILPGQPVTLTNGFTYSNTPPIAAMSASPVQGPSPLVVMFNIGASFDPDGMLTERILDYGDGTSYTFPSDLNVVTVTHTYTGNTMYTATLTVTDDQGAQSMATQLITVGHGGQDVNSVLVLRTMSIKIDTTMPQLNPPPSKDHVTLTGEIVLPSGVTPDSLTAGSVSISIKDGVSVNNVDPLPLALHGAYKGRNETFTMKLKKRPGTPSGTYTFLYVHKNGNLLTSAPVLPPDTNRLIIPVYIRLKNSLGREFYYGNGMADIQGDPTPKQAVVTVKKTKNNATLSLVRN